MVQGESRTGSPSRNTTVDFILEDHTGDSWQQQFSVGTISQKLQAGFYTETEHSHHPFSFRFCETLPDYTNDRTELKPTVQVARYDNSLQLSSTRPLGVWFTLVYNNKKNINRPEKKTITKR